MARFAQNGVSIHAVVLNDVRPKPTAGRGRSDVGYAYQYEYRARR